MNLIPYNQAMADSIWSARSRGHHTVGWQSRRLDGLQRQMPFGGWVEDFYTQDYRFGNPSGTNSRWGVERDANGSRVPL